MLDAAVSRPSRTSLRSSRVVPLALTGVMLLIPVVLVSVSFWPGHMNADTLTQIDQVRTGRLNNWHATLLLAIWIPLWDLGVGPGMVLTGQVIVFVSGVFLVLRSAFSALAAALATMLVSLSPAIFGSLGLLGRDVWFIAPLLLAFGLLFAVPRTEGRTRTALFAGALVAVWFALAARQNAAAAVVMATIAWVALVRAPAPGKRVRHGVVTVIAGIGLTVALILSQLGLAAALDPDDANPEQYLFTYDLASISHRQGENLFPPDVVRDRGMTAIDQHFDVNNVVPMLVGPGHPVEPFLGPPQTESLARAWRTAVLDHPLDYLDTRWEVFWRQVALTQPSIQIYHPVIDGNPWGLKIRFPEANETAKGYIEEFGDEAYNGNVLFTVWVYLLAALAVGIYLLARGRDQLERCIGIFALSAITYQFGIAIGAMGVGFRLEFPAVVIGVLSVLLLIGVLAARRRATARLRST